MLYLLTILLNYDIIEEDTGIALTTNSKQESQVKSNRLFARALRTKTPPAEARNNPNHWWWKVGNP